MCCSRICERLLCIATDQVEDHVDLLSPNLLELRFSIIDVVGCDRRRRYIVERQLPTVSNNLTAFMRVLLESAQWAPKLIACWQVSTSTESGMLPQN
jgi:hypothetical protein